MGKLFKSHNVLWDVISDLNSVSNREYYPLCPVENCHMELLWVDNGYFCENCQKQYPQTKDHYQIRNLVYKKYHGFRTLDSDIYSLDLLPTKIVGEDEDENYWIRAKLGEKNGKRMAVIYFGEKMNSKQNKDDYVQTFIDFEDEQVRFDKSNKNPIKLLGKLIAEFPDSKTIIKRK